MESTTDRYNAPARFLHWLVAGMIVLQYVLANLASTAEVEGERFRELVLLANHKSVGLSILTLAVVRLIWRLSAPRPAALPMARWQQTAAAISHWGFYALLLLVPLSGWLMSSASNISVSWFNLFQLPDLVGPDENLEARLANAHMVFARILFFLAVLHVAAAAKHTFIDKDGALRRVASPTALLAFVITIAAGVLWLVPESRADDTELPAWRIDYDASSLRFEAVQAGATFEGSFESWEADLRFATDAIDRSSFDVEVKVASVATLDRDRDETLLDAEFFDGENHPVVRYVAKQFSTAADGSFVADGSIEVKGISTPAPLEFTVERQEREIVLNGTARLDRLELRVGTAEWEDTEWIGQFVDVTVRVVAEIN